MWHRSRVATRSKSAAWADLDVMDDGDEGASTSQMNLMTRWRGHYLVASAADSVVVTSRIAGKDDIFASLRTFFGAGK